jgi:hypothetical protein
MILYSVVIHGPEDQLVSVQGCPSREEAVYQCVDLAIESGWRPPGKWQFWLPRWPDDCMAEYERRVA